MPIYNYRCEGCGREKQEFRPINTSIPGPNCDECKVEMEKIPSVPMPTIIHEKAGQKGKNVRRGVTTQLKERSHEHFVKHEMDDLIQEHGVNNAKDFGWLDRKSGKKKNLIDEK